MKTNLNRGERIIKIKNFIPGPRDFDYRKQRQVVQISNKTNRHNLDKQKRSKLKAICKLLRENVSYYNVVGFYLADRKHTELLLVPFKGHPTEHVRIAFGVGTCGKATKQKKRFVIQDITKETNYLSCSKKLELKFFQSFVTMKLLGNMT